MEGLHPSTKVSGITGLEGIIDPASCVIQGVIEAIPLGNSTDIREPAKATTIQNI